MSLEAVTQASSEVSLESRVALRRRPRLAWSDAAGAHTATVETRMVIGSAPDVDLVIADPTVSRLHAEVEPRDDGLWVRDLGSRNGTYVESIRVAGARVPEGAVLKLGSTVMALADAAEPLAVELWPGASFGPLIGRSTVMRELFARLAKVAAVDSTVLVLGETGTGKELVARAVHDSSRRAQGPFVIVDCAALPENLLEAELFGHARGAYTGAQSSRAGAFEVADGGTVFLDEIGELPPAMQPKLLRVLESGSVRRIGETAHRKINVRFISATNRDLRAMVNAGAFRDDLYFRLAVVPVAIPPLREHSGDIPQLVDHFLASRVAPTFDGAALSALSARPWLGNVRELRNFVERAVAFGAGDALSQMPDKVSMRVEAMPPVPLDRPFKEIRETWLNHLEREYVRGMLARHDGNITEVAEASGLDRSYVHRLVRKHDL